MERLWIAVLLALGAMMVFKPEILFKIENLFVVKNGEPTELYMTLMRLGGLFFIMCSVVMIVYSAVEG